MNLTTSSTAKEAYPRYTAYVDGLHATLDNVGITKNFQVKKLSSNEFLQLWLQIQERMPHWIQRLNDGYDIDSQKIKRRTSEVLQRDN